MSFARDVILEAAAESDSAAAQLRALTAKYDALLLRLHGCYANGGTCDEDTVREIVEEFAPGFKP